MPPPTPAPVVAAPTAPSPSLSSPPPPPALAPLLAWLVERAAVDREACALVRVTDPDALAAGANDPERLARALLAIGRPADALRLIGCALPPREGVWWAWVAARHAAQVAQARAAAPAPPPGAADGAAPPVPPLPPTQQELDALAAVERWVAQPTDEHRRQAWAAGQAAGLETPAGSVAAAAYFSTGSLAAPHSPMVVPPPPGAHAAMAAGAVLLAAAHTDALHLADVAGAFLAQAVAVVRRLGGWEPAAVAARQHFIAQREQHERAVTAATAETPPPAA